MPSEQFEEELREITIVVRSLITSTKPPVSLANIERDYMNVEQTPIPFRRLGFRNTLELLQETNAFDFQKFGNDIIVRAKPNPKSAHIASMVRSQKSSGKPKTANIFSRPQVTSPVRIVRPVCYINAPSNYPKQGQAQQWQGQPVPQKITQKQAMQAVKAVQQIGTQKSAQQQKAKQQRAAQQQQLTAQLAAQKALQQQQAAQRAAQVKLEGETKLQTLNKEFGRLREEFKKQEDLQKRNEQEIIELQLKHKRVQADTIDKLNKTSLERLELQSLLKQQEQVQQKHELALREQAEIIEKLKRSCLLEQQELKKEQQQEQYNPQQQLEATVIQTIKQQQVWEVKKPEEIKTEKEFVKPTTTTSAFESASAKLAAMNGNAAAATTSRKPHLRPILGNSAPQQQRPTGQVQQHPPMMTAGATTTATAGRRQQHPRVQYPSTRPTSGISVNYRLKQQQTAAVAPPASPQAPAAAPLIITPPDSPENVAINKQASPKAEAATTAQPEKKKPSSDKQPLKQTVNFKFDPAYDAITSLQQYCAAQGYPPPEYEYTNVLKSNRMHCKLHIGTNIFTSYPEEHQDEESAKKRTADIALERLKQLQSREKLKVLSETAFLDSLYQELIKHPHGIVSHKLAEWYEATVKRQVPNNWFELINSSHKIRIESSINTNIVFANTPTEAAAISITNLVAPLPPLQQPHTQAQHLTDSPSAMPELQLPWVEGQQDWSMYITHCDSTMHVWARLIDQSSNFEKLTEQLNAHMSRKQERQPVVEPVEQKIYLVEVSENWNRVRLQSADAEQRQCICHFIDFGDEVIFGYDALYECPSQFLALPAQAVCLSMYALDKFEEHPHAQPVLAKELAGHSVVTRIITNEMQFFRLGGRTQGVLLPPQQQSEKAEQSAGGLQPSVRRACIVGTFYDTSTAEDIHLNDLVANRIIRSTPSPMLKLDQKSNHVLVSHVNDVGDLMVLIPNEDLKFVQRSIARIMNDANEQHRVGYSDLLHDQLVCVCDEAGEGGKQWYRGMLTAKPKSAEEEVFDVYYVDDGRLRKTHISNIYRLEANNLALASYPAQALRVRLHDVPPIDNQMVGRLRGLLSPQTPVLLKVMEGANDKLPMVTIHARGQDSLYLCLNSAIRMEYEVQSTTRLEPFDDGGLHFSPTGQLIRRGSFSSTVSSHSSSSDQPSGVVSPPATPRKTTVASPAKAAPAITLKEYEAIPAIGAYFEVRVALSVNPGHFAVQPYKHYNQLQRMMKDLQAHCKSSAAKPVQPSQLAIGQAYAAAESDGVYHRVNIRKIYDEMIHVRYVDAGDDGVVRCNQLLQLTPEFRELPMMALPAQLYGIQLTGIDWTKENCVRFRQLTLGQKFIGIVKRIDKLKDDRRALSLELIDTSTPEDIKVHETLISEKHALPAP